MWWIATLFATNEIPSVVVTFVALIIFLQTGMGMAEATSYAAALLLPWVTQPVMKRPAQALGGSRVWLHLTELLLTALLMTFALTLGKGKWWMLSILMVISTFSAWHDLLARRFYLRQTGSAPSVPHSVLRVLSSNMATVLTYGLMIMAVGVLQIYFRQRSVAYSWSLGCYILAGTYMALTLMNLATLSFGRKTDGHTPADTADMPTDVGSNLNGVWQIPILALMLMPQGLMFYSRTIFLLSSPEAGGLGCTLQDVGFAQGTIGVISFLLGITLGTAIQKRWGDEDTRWMLAVCLGLSPLAYLSMTILPPHGLWALSAYTFTAQLLFGLGLNSCRKIIGDISGESELEVVNPLYSPVISLSILLSMIISGFLLKQMSFNTFFLIDVLCAPVGWIAITVVEYLHKHSLAGHKE